MNVFGAFTFGGLIKTFIPGLVWLVALWLVWGDAAAMFPDVIPALPDLAGEEQTTLVVAIPGGILLGVLSNIVVFMGLNDRLVRLPARRRDAELFLLYDGLCDQVRRQHWLEMACVRRELEGPFLRRADAEVLILKSTGVSELAFIREQYWYHLEFQVNMLLAVFCSLIALLASPAILAGGLSPPHAERAVLEIVVLGGLCSLLRRAALKNYNRHVGKMCTLLSAHLCERTEARRPRDGAGKAGSADLPDCDDEPMGMG